MACEMSCLAYINDIKESSEMKRDCDIELTVFGGRAEKQHLTKTKNCSKRN
jgi:hypothetical protein